MNCKIVTGVRRALRIDRGSIVRLYEDDFNAAPYQPLVCDGWEVQLGDDDLVAAGVIDRGRNARERGRRAVCKGDLALTRVQHSCHAGAELGQPPHPGFVPGRGPVGMPILVELGDARFRAATGYKPRHTLAETFATMAISPDY